MVQAKPEIIKHFKTPGLEVIYTLFLALMIALFFGLGVSAFYTSPKPPEYPTVLSVPSKDGSMTQEQINIEVSFEKAQKKYQTEFSTYSRNVSIITLILAVIALAISLIFLGNIYVISNGLL